MVSTQASGTATQRSFRDNGWIFGSMLVGGLLALVASFVLSYDALQLARDSSVNLACDINSVLSCGVVGKHETATLVGDIPNSFFGMMTIPVIIVIAVLGLARVRLPHWFTAAAFLGYTGGLVFAWWLFYTSYVTIGALCPWCLTVQVGMTLAWFAMARFYIRDYANLWPKKIAQPLQKFIKNTYDIATMISLLVVVAALIIIKYGPDLFR